MTTFNFLALICSVTPILHVHGYGNRDHLLSGNIVAGAGYSTDAQQVTAQRCYNVRVSSYSSQQSYVELGEAISSSDLANMLGVSVDISGSFGEFSAEAKANYVRSIQDSDYAMSLNYYQYSQNDAALQVGGYGLDALTPIGQEYYKNGTNPYFGLVCGDKYITSYQQGALLSMGLHIKFNSVVVKTEFEQAAGGSFGSIISAAESVKLISNQRKLRGSITIHAFQIGGEPSKLSEILNEDSTGNFYALTCSLTEIENCVKTASGLLAYAKDDFSMQFSFEDNKGLTPLGVAFSQYQPIEWLGLTLPESLINPDVLESRSALSDKLKENEYYRQKLYPFLNNGYPVKLDDGFIRKVNSIMNKVMYNLNLLMQQHGGGADCFFMPDKCNVMKIKIFAELRNITASDLAPMNDMKYMMSFWGGKWYNTGAGTAEGWDVIFTILDKYTEVTSRGLTNGIFSFCLKRAYELLPLFDCFEGELTFDGMKYAGTISAATFNGPHGSFGTVDRVLSPFYFEPYDSATSALTDVSSFVDQAIKSIEFDLSMFSNRAYNKTL